MLVGADEAELVAKAGGAVHIGRAAVEGDHHGEVELEFAAVEGDEPTSGAVDLAGVELGYQLDVLLGQEPAELGRRHRLGEGAVERRDVDQIDAIADPTFAEVPVGEEAELQRCDRALDRQVDHVDHQPAAVEGGQRRFQPHRAVEVVEGVDPVAPARTGQSFGLLRHEPGAGRDHEDVVAEHGAVGQVHPVAVDVDALDFAAVETDALGQLARP